MRAGPRGVQCVGLLVAGLAMGGCFLTYDPSKEGVSVQVGTPSGSSSGALAFFVASSVGLPANDGNAARTRVYFAADSGAGPGLWISDGTAAGTVLGARINNNLGASVSPIVLGTINGDALLAIDDGVRGRELWRSNGTAAGTLFVRDINPGANGSLPFPDAFEAVTLNGVLFFVADDGARGFELWRTDGTAAGTQLVKDINVGANGAFTPGRPNPLIAVGNVLYFVANDGVKGEELWQSDGTEAGTVLVKDINPSAAAAGPASLVALNGLVYFQADDGIRGVELWRSDGTAAGTVMVADIVAGAASSAPRLLTAAGNLLFFAVDDGIRGVELWRSDGTAAGTVLVRDIHPTGGALANTGERQIAAVGAVVYFAASDGQLGTELWRSDGTAAGTFRVKDINVGVASSNPSELIAVKSTLFFTATDNTRGLELWQSDGTATGTVIARDIRAGSGSSNPASLVEDNGTLFFTASDGVNTGTGLFAISVP